MHRGVRNGPVHLYESGNEWTAVALCGRRVKLWNMEGDTEEDFCPRCITVARQRLQPNNVFAATQLSTNNSEIEKRLTQ